LAFVVRHIIRNMIGIAEQSFIEALLRLYQAIPR
jgi:hypothetical protein